MMQVSFLHNMATLPPSSPLHPSPFESLPMAKIENPTNTDVLLGRGVATNRHPGNENFRDIVSQHVDIYVTSTKKQKMLISRSIVDKVHKHLDPPGRFLEKDPDTGLWSEVGDKKALEKTAQALRDGAAPLRKQLSEDMSDPGFLSAVFDDGDFSSNQEPAPRKGHRRMNTAPVRSISLPLSAFPDPKRSRQNSPVHSPVENLDLQSIVVNNLMVNHAASPMLSNTSMNLSLSPLTTQSPAPLSGRKSPSSPRANRANKKKGHHRRLRTFGGYSCSDSIAMAPLSKEDLMNGIPPLFASQLPHQPMQMEETHDQVYQLEQAQTQTQVNHWPPVFPLSTTSHEAPVTASKRSFHGHRRHQTMGAFAFTQASPVFSDDPTLNFSFGGQQEAATIHNTPAEPELQLHQNQDFSMLNLEIPELPFSRPPPTTSGRGRHRRMHTTGQFNVGKNQDTNFLDSFAPLPLEPLHEEKQWQSPSALDDIMESLEPLHNKSKTNNTTENHEPQTSLTDEDFLKMTAANGFAEELDVYEEDSSQSEGGHHLIGDCEPSSFAPNNNNLDHNGSFHVQPQDAPNTLDADFANAMGSDDHFLNLFHAGPLDIDDESVFGTDQNNN